MYEHLSRGYSSHIGKRFVRTALASFMIPRAGGDHHCLVHIPLWGSLRDMIARSPDRDRFTEPLLRATLYRLFKALDYLHTDRKIVHTGMISDCVLAAWYKNLFIVNHRQTSVPTTFFWRSKTKPCLTDSSTRNWSIPHLASRLAILLSMLLGCLHGHPAVNLFFATSDPQRKGTLKTRETLGQICTERQK